MELQYRTRGTCARLIQLRVEDGKVHDVHFLGGCDGNLQAVGRLVEGMDVKEAISRLSGIRCGGKPTSYPDQLSLALRQALAQEEQKQ